MIEFGQHTIPKTCLGIIRVAGLFRFAMMYMMRDYVDFFGYCFDDEILCNNTPQRMTKAKGFMGTVPMKPNRSMRSHDYHAVNNDGNHKIPGKVFEKEKKKERQHSCKSKEADKRYPVVPGFKNIHAGKGLRPKLLCCRNNKSGVLVFPSVRWSVEKTIYK